MQRRTIELTTDQLELVAEVMKSYLQFVYNELFEAAEGYPTLPQDEIDYLEAVRALHNEIAEAVGFATDDEDWNAYGVEEDELPETA